MVGDAHTHSQINSQLFLPFKFPFHLKTIEKCILLKTVTALKTRLTGRILVMIPTDQVLFVSGVQLGRAEKIKCPDELVRYMFRFEFHLIIHFIRFKCLSSAECKTLLFSFFIFLPLAKPIPTPKKGFIGKGKDITTKHDEVVCGRKNTARMENVSYRKYYLSIKSLNIF